MGEWLSFTDKISFPDKYIYRQLQECYLLHLSATFLTFVYVENSNS